MIAFLKNRKPSGDDSPPRARVLLAGKGELYTGSVMGAAAAGLAVREYRKGLSSPVKLCQAPSSGLGKKNYFSVFRRATSWFQFKAIQRDSKVLGKKIMGRRRRGSCSASVSVQILGLNPIAYLNLCAPI